jgi:alanine racemase
MRLTPAAATPAATSGAARSADAPATVVPPPGDHLTVDLPGGYRPTWAEVDLEAVRHNVQLLRQRAEPARLMAVVKADAYGHGAVPVARAALEAGATWLGVATVEEGMELRFAGIHAPILLLSEPTVEAAAAVVAAGLTPMVYTRRWVQALAGAVSGAGTAPVAVHVKVDTGMHRAGCAPQDALVLAREVEVHPALCLEGLCTHLAVADEPGHSYTAEQLGRFEAVRADLSTAGIRPPVVHASNSAALLTAPQARYDLVRSGIALYGIPPCPALEGLLPLRPALSLRARISCLRRLQPGEAVSYGLRYRLTEASTIATVPIGYADGVPRRFSEVGGEVLVGGRRRPVAGTVTMDQLLVDLGDDDPGAGAEVVLIGSQGSAEITAAEWAARLGTIPYEVCCAIGPRVPRLYRG